MKFGTDEYYAALAHLMRIVVEEGEAGLYTDKGVREDGTTFLFRIVKALAPFGVILSVYVEPMEDTEDE